MIKTEQPASRLVEVDWIKAISVPAVVALHSMRAVWDPAVTWQEVWLSHLLLFAVPAFLFCSGYLDASMPWQRLTGDAMRARARRLLIPYVIASLLAELYQAALLGRPLSPSIVAWDLVFASAFGIYYYVLSALVCVLLLPLLRERPQWQVLAIFLVFFGIQVRLETLDAPLLSFTWWLRNPLNWVPYYVLGWVVRPLAPLLGDVAARNRVWLVPALASIAVALSLLGALLAERLPAWVGIYFWLGFLYSAFRGFTRLPPIVRALSDASYFYYLFHFFIVVALQVGLQRIGAETGLVAIVMCWAVTLGGCSVLRRILLRLLGPRARTYIGG